MSISIIKNKTVFTVELKEKKGNSNYNLWAYIYKPTDKVPIAGTCFKYDSKVEDIKKWALDTLETFDMKFLTN